jgi:hypothetical protein
MLQGFRSALTQSTAIVVACGIRPARECLYERRVTELVFGSRERFFYLLRLIVSAICLASGLKFASANTDCGFF